MKSQKQCFITRLSTPAQPTIYLRPVAAVSCYKELFLQDFFQYLVGQVRINRSYSPWIFALVELSQGGWSWCWRARLFAFLPKSSRIFGVVFFGGKIGVFRYIDSHCLNSWQVLASCHCLWNHDETMEIRSKFHEPCTYAHYLRGSSTTANLYFLYLYLLNIYSVEITNLCMTSVWFEWWSSVVPFVRPSFVVFLPRTDSYLSCWELSILEVLCCCAVSWFFTNSFWQPGGPFHQKLSERVFACKNWWHLAASQLPHVWLDHEANIGRPSELPGCQHLSALKIERYLSDIWKISESLKDAKKKQKIKRIGIELILNVVTKSDCSMLHGALRKRHWGAAACWLEACGTPLRIQPRKAGKLVIFISTSGYFWEFSASFANLS